MSPDILPIAFTRPEELPPLPLVVDARRLARLLCCGIRTVRTWDSAGRLPAPLRIGGRVVWRVDEIRGWLAAGAPCRDVWGRNPRRPEVTEPRNTKPLKRRRASPSRPARNGDSGCHWRIYPCPF